MKLPRDLSGENLASLLRRYGYSFSRQSGSHIRLTSSYTGETHHITILRYASLKVGLLSAILSEVAAYIGVEGDDLIQTLFGD